MQNLSSNIQSASNLYTNHYIFPYSKFLVLACLKKYHYLKLASIPHQPLINVVEFIFNFSFA